MAPSFAKRSLARSTPKVAAYSRMLGKKAPSRRSWWIPRTITTQAPASATPSPRPELLEAVDVGARDPRVEHVAHDRDGEAVDAPLLLEHGQQVEQGLGGMLVRAGAGVDHRRGELVRDAPAPAPPSPPLTPAPASSSRMRLGPPATLWRPTTASGSMASRVLAVSRMVSAL